MLDAFKKLFGILPYRDRLKFAILFGLMLIGTLLEVIGIGMIPVFISAVADPNMLLNNRFAGPVLAGLGIDNARDLLITGGFTLVAVFFIKGTYLISLHYAKSKFIYGRFEVIANALFKTYMFSPYTFHLNRNTAELIRNVTNETRYISNNVMKPLLIILMEGITTMGIFVLLLIVEPVITVVTFLILGGGGGFILKILKGRLKKYGKIASLERSRMIQGVNEGLGAFKDVTVTNRQNFFMGRFHHFVANLKKAEIVKNLSSEAVKPVIEFMAVGGMMTIALVMVFQGRPIAAIIPVLTLFGAATIRLMPAVSKIVSQVTTLRYYVYALEPVYKDIMEGSRRDLVPVQKSLNDVKLSYQSEIELVDVHYRYPNTTEPALRGINLTIPRGSAVGFVGTSGAGKSTLVDVILGLLEPQHGCILVDEADIAKHKRAWQNNVGYIPQFIYLSDDTIRNNIAFGIPEEEIPDEKIDSAVKAAQLEELIETLDEGLDTMIGERGVRLSGGQRQRIGIARAIYDNPKVLIMDEATSALDNATEKQVIKAIEALKGERTIIMIAHRLTTVMNCDRLYLMESGRIIHQGTYGELIGASEKFREMSMERD